MSGLDGNHHPSRTSVPLVFDVGWIVGPAMFGGAIVRELVVAATGAIGGSTWVAIEVSARFLRPLPAGSAVIELTVVHAGRASRVAEAHVIRDGRVAVVATITWAPKDVIPVAGRVEPAVLPPAVPSDGDNRHDMGAVARRVDWRVEGTWGPAEGDLRSWIALRGDPRPMAAEFVFLAADLLVPALPGARADIPLRVASLAMNVSLLAVPSSHWLRQETVAHRVGTSGAHAVMNLIAADGTLVGRAMHRGLLMPADLVDMPYSATAFGRGLA